VEARQSYWPENQWGGWTSPIARPPARADKPEGSGTIPPGRNRAGRSDTLFSSPRSSIGKSGRPKGGKDARESRDRARAHGPKRSHVAP